jgi:4-amino-4-deoxy-L-arabinose transferase-like glycosyltransferase
MDVTLQDGRGWRLGMFAVCLLLVAVALVLLSTPWGIGVGYDSTFYLSATQGIVDGQGISRLAADGIWTPLTHFPPLYPLVLAAGSIVTGTTPVAAARSANALLFGLNVLLAAAIVRRWSRSSLAGAAAGAFFLLSPVLIERHLWAMSEPLYFTMLLAFLGSLPAAMRSRAGWPLAALGLLAGLAALTRYVGVALIGCGVASIALFSTGAWRGRLVKACVFLMVSVVPVAGWLMRNRLVQAGLTNRTLAFHPLTREKAAEAARAIGSWTAGPIMSWKLAGSVSAVLLLALVVLAVWLAWHGRQAGEDESALGLPASVLLLHAVAYGGALLLSLTFFDASTRLDNRILSPLYITFLLLAAITLPAWLNQRGPVVRVCGAGVLLVIALTYIWASAALVQEGRIGGFGFQSRTWRTSEGVAYVDGLEPSRPVYSNESIPLRFLLGRQVYPAPERLDPVLARVRPDYQQQLSTMRDRLQRADGVLLLFHADSLRVEMPSKAELTEGLALTERFLDSEVYAPSD